MSDTTTEAEIMYAIRRADGEELGDYSFIVTSDTTLERAAKDYADEDYEPAEFELIKMTVEVIERRMIGPSPEPCAKWTGHTSPRRSWVAVEIRPDGSKETWPMNMTSLKHCDSQAEADQYIERMPDEFYVHPGQEPVLINRSRLTTRHQSIGPYFGNCDTCHWAKEKHGAPRDE